MVTSVVKRPRRFTGKLHGQDGREGGLEWGEVEGWRNLWMVGEWNEKQGQKKTRREKRMRGETLGWGKGIERGHEGEGKEKGDENKKYIRVREAAARIREEEGGATTSYPSLGNSRSATSVNLRARETKVKQVIKLITTCRGYEWMA